MHKDLCQRRRNEVERGIRLSLAHSVKRRGARESPAEMGGRGGMRVGLLERGWNQGRPALAQSGMCGFFTSFRKDFSAQDQVIESTLIKTGDIEMK